MYVYIFAYGSEDQDFLNNVRNHDTENLYHVPTFKKNVFLTFLH